MSKNVFRRVQAECVPAVEKAIESFFEEARRKLHSGCAQTCAYQFSTGGKRLRAAIPSLVYAVAGADPMHAVPLGAAAELLHNATLVHDDLQDGDSVRRGHPTVWKRFTPAQAINCGNALFHYAYVMLDRLHANSARKLRIHELAVRCMLLVIEGQEQDLRMKEEEEPGVERYLGVARGKTSGLFVFPAVGALMALGISPSLCETVERSMSDLGAYFQVRDDLLDLYGHKGRDHHGSDVAEGKVSALAAHVFEAGGASQKAELRAILRKPREETTRLDTQKAVTIFEMSGARHAAESLAERLRAGAIETASRHQTAGTIVHEFLSAL